MNQEQTIPVARDIVPAIEVALRAAQKLEAKPDAPTASLTHANCLEALELALQLVRYYGWLAP